MSMGPSPVTFVHEGDMIAGKYCIERILGQGGMGLVAAAMHVDLCERRAIKFMLPSCLGDSEFVERFLREARACARLKSRHVATVYDVGRLENGVPYIVMEYLEGTDLRTLLLGHKALPIHEATGYLIQACEALGEAHEAGIIHRDIKPANLFLAAGVGGVPCVKVLDFGVAKLGCASGWAPDQYKITKTGAVLGSPLYMSPEQMRASPDIDARADIWSLGVVLYRMVTGALPFPALGTLDLCVMILTISPPRPSSINPEVPPGLDAVIMRCLEKDPFDRWPSVAHLASVLQPYADPSIASVVARSSSPASSVRSRESVPGRISDLGGHRPSSGGAEVVRRAALSSYDFDKTLVSRTKRALLKADETLRSLTLGARLRMFGAAVCGTVLIGGLGALAMERRSSDADPAKADLSAVGQDGGAEIAVQPAPTEPAVTGEVPPKAIPSAVASVDIGPAASGAATPSATIAAAPKVKRPATPPRPKKSEQGEQDERNPFGRDPYLGR